MFNPLESNIHLLISYDTVSINSADKGTGISLKILNAVFALNHIIHSMGEIETFEEIMIYKCTSHPPLP